MEQKLTELDNELKDIRASLNATINGLTEAEIIEAFPEVLVLEILKPAAAPSDIDELRKRLNQ